MLKRATNLRKETLKNDRRSHKLSTVSSLELPPKGIVLHAAQANPQKEFSRSVKRWREMNVFRARSFKRDFTWLNIWVRVRTSPTACHKWPDRTRCIFISLLAARDSCDDHYFSYGVTVVMHTMWKRTRRFLLWSLVSFGLSRPGPGPLGISSLISCDFLRTAGVFFWRSKSRRERRNIL